MVFFFFFRSMLLVSYKLCVKCAILELYISYHGLFFLISTLCNDMREPNFPWQFFHEIACRLTKFSIWLVICNWNLLSQDLYNHALEILLILRITREQWNFAKFRLVALNNLCYEWNYIFRESSDFFSLNISAKKSPKIWLLKNEIYRNKYKFGENTQTSMFYG